MSNSLSDQTTPLAENLQQELSLTLQLLDLLRVERDTITSKEMEQLTQLAGKKQQLLTQLQVTTQKREALLRQNNLPVSKEGMAQLIDATQSADIADCWQRLTDAAANCQEQNRQLGMLIQREQNNVRQAQHILQRGTPNKPVAYNAAGSTDDDTKTRRIAKV